MSNSINDLGTYKSLGEAFIAILKFLYTNGVKCSYTDNPDESFEVKEAFNLSIKIENPDSKDHIIESYKSLDEETFMNNNFKSPNSVKELGNSRSYYSRLYEYGNIKNQIEWVINRLKSNRNQRSATITTLEPLTDEYYIPCVSLLDFQVDQNDSSSLDLNVYARAIDFSTKGYMNLILLSDILDEVSGDVNLNKGSLTLIIKSAHYRIDNEDRIETLIKRNQKH